MGRTKRYVADENILKKLRIKVWDAEKKQITYVSMSQLDDISFVKDWKGAIARQLGKKRKEINEKIEVLFV